MTESRILIIAALIVVIVWMVGVMVAQAVFN